MLGVHPYLPKDEIIERFTPLADYLANSLGSSVEVRVGRNYDEHINAIGSNAIDIAYLGPVSYIELVKKFGTKPLLARQVINNDPFPKGVISVRRNSAIRTLSDLKGKCFAFGDPHSATGSVLPKKLLQRAGVYPDKLARGLVLEGYKNVALVILAGDCDAGALTKEVYKEFAPKGLRVLRELTPVPDQLFVARSDLSPELLVKLSQSFLMLNKLPDGRAIMTAIHPQMTALVVPKDSDYDGLRITLNDEPQAQQY